MDKFEVQPFIDESGNLVIPPAMYGKPNDVKEVDLQTAKGIIRIFLAGSKVVRVIQLEEFPANQPLSSNDKPIVEQGDCPEKELLKLAQSSMEFWDNPVDDAVWNNA